MTAMQIWTSMVCPPLGKLLRSNVPKGGGVSRHDSSAEKNQAVHSCIDPDSDIVSRPLLPERPAQMPRCPQDLVARDGCGPVFFPGAAITPELDADAVHCPAGASAGCAEIHYRCR